MTPSRATTNSCNLPDQEKALFEPTPLRATAAPASAGRRGGATITLRLPVTRLQTKEVTGEDGFVISAPVPVTTMKDFDFCARNIECSCLHGSGDKEAARALEHHPRECGRPHYNPKNFGGKKLCTFAISRVPCRFGSACGNIHPENYPQVVPTASGGGGGGGARQAGPRQGGAVRPVFVANKLMCWKELAGLYHVPLPEGESVCSGNCGYAHSIKDQYVPPQITAFDALVAAGTLNVQEMTLEVHSVLTSLSREELSQVLDANRATQLPQEHQSSLDMWFNYWSKAASSMRKSNPHALALFDGADSPKENLVWELCRRLNVCWTSEKHLKALHGGKSELTCPTKKEPGAARIDYRAVKTALQNKVITLSAEHAKLHAAANVKGQELSVRTAAMAAARECKALLTTAQRQLESAEMVPICQGGVSCRNGVHKDLCGPSGVLAAIDVNNFNGRTSSYHNRSDIVEYRARLVKDINKLQLEYQVKKDDSTITRGGERAANEQRLSAIKDELSYLRNELANAYNLTRLFPEPVMGTSSIIFSVPKEEVVASYVYDATDFVPMEVMESVEETLENFMKRVRVNVFHQLSHRFRSQSRTKVTKFLANTIGKLGRISAKQHYAVASAASKEEALSKYRDLIESKYLCVLPHDPSVKGRVATRDRRTIFYVSDKEVFVGTETGSYKLYTGRLMTPTLEACLASFNQELFVQFFNSGAFKAMSYSDFSNPLTREAWEQFRTNPPVQAMGWVAFAKDTTLMRAKWNQLGTVVVKTVNDGAWSKEDPTAHIQIEEQYIGCPEKDLLYANFWGYYFKTPKASDMKLVGTPQASLVATESLSIFQEWLTFPSLIVRSGGTKVFDGVVKTATFAEWLTLNPKYSAAFAALNSGGPFAGHSFRTISFFVNSVAPVSRSISIDAFAKNETLMRMWVSSSASKNIGGALGGVEFSTFVTAPFDYNEYYSSAYPRYGMTFAQFLESRAGGWKMTKASNTLLLQQTSLAYLPKEAFEAAVDLLRRNRLLNLQDCIISGDKPMKLNIILGNKTLSVPPSIYDPILCELAKLLRMKANKVAVQDILNVLPTSELEAQEYRDDLITGLRAAHHSKIASLCEELSALVVNLPCRNKVTPALLLSLQSNASEATLTTIRGTFGKLTSANGRLFQSKFEEYVTTLAVDIAGNIKQFNEETTTAVCAYTDASGKLVQPTLIAAAQEYLDSDDKVVSTKSAKSAKSTKSAPAPASAKKTTKLALPSQVEDEFLSGEAQLLGGSKKQDNKLLLSGRIGVPRDSVLYWTLVKEHFEGKDKSAKEAAVKAKSLAYWHIGPFPDKDGANKVKKALSSGGRGGVTVLPFAENGVTVYEVQMPDLANKVHEKAKKWDMSAEEKDAALRNSTQETIQLIAIAAKAYGFTEDKVFSPELAKYRTPAAAAPKRAAAAKPSVAAPAPADGFEFASDDEDETPVPAPAPASASPSAYESASDDESSDESSDDEDEVIITRTVYKARDAPASSIPTIPGWVQDLEVAPKQGRKHTKGRR